MVLEDDPLVATNQKMPREEPIDGLIRAEIEIHGTSAHAPHLIAIGTSSFFLPFEDSLLSPTSYLPEVSALYLVSAT